MSSMRKPLGAIISMLAVSALGIVGTTGCQTESFCWDKCAGDDATGGRGNTGGNENTGGSSSSGNGGEGGCIFNCSTSSSSGQGGAGACEKTNGGVEICDTLDNDCNSVVDDVDANSPDLQKITSCGSCDNNCNAILLNAKGIKCESGVCTAAECAPGWWDLSSPKDYICEYYCVKSADDDSLCNNKDDDCDNLKDEDVDFCTSTSDCGSCDNNCVVLNGTPGCSTTAMPGQACTPANTKCTIGQCDPGWVDLDKSYATGCEYACTPNAATMGVETCNGIDDDCDGLTDAVDDLAGDMKIGSDCWGDPVGLCGAVASKGAFACVNNAYECVGPNVVKPGDKPEVCNGIDDDCDGVTDDNPTGINMLCGDSATYPCKKGTQQCINGALQCIGAVNPTIELCNGTDDDCDGTTDDMPTDVGGMCGSTAVGACELGQVACQGGTKVCVGSIEPKTETCNGVDDDCDGAIDDVAGAGTPCGQSNVAPCKLGVFQCVGTALSCVGNVDPKTETCNMVDDDCDMAIDENLPPQPCLPMGADPNKVYGGLSQCRKGSQACGGACVGYVGPSATETCDSIDNDCDGLVDEDLMLGMCNVPIPPPMGATSPCKAGTQTCTSGVLLCVGSIGPTTNVDTCGVDANCDGLLTGQPDKLTDIANCGTCGNNCYANNQHEIRACVNGMCVVQGCETGYYDLNNDGICEYACSFKQAQEACNGEDDNCNGQIDEMVVKPTPVQVCGVSTTATSAECTTGVTVSCIAGTWQCSFPAGICTGGCSANDEICDTLDNDCDGFVNENVPNFNQPCASDDMNPNPGDGACRTTGVYQCVGASATACSAIKANCAVLPGGCTELCDGIDNDCDGSTDETYQAPGTNAANYVKPAVTKIGAATWITSYEVSRPNATQSTPGTGNGYHTSAPAGVTLDKTRACSVPSKLPWFNVSPLEVEQTCVAMGGTICATPDWTTACQVTPTMSPCTWGYNPRGAACTTSFVAGSKFCNLGHSYDFDAMTNGDQDGLLPAGSPFLGNCWADWSGLQSNTTATNKIFDVTGNLREITRSNPGEYSLMGGAFNAPTDTGATCTFSFYKTKSNAFRLYDLGFRCCFPQNPSP